MNEVALAAMLPRLDGYSLATAKDFAQKANAGLNIVRFLVAQKAQQDERLLPVADAVKTLRATSEGSTLILRAEMSVDNIQKLMQNFNPN